MRYYKTLFFFINISFKTIKTGGMGRFTKGILKYSFWRSLQISEELANIKSIISNLPTMFPSDWIRGSFDRSRKLDFDSNAPNNFCHRLSKYFKSHKNLKILAEREPPYTNVIPWIWTKQFGGENNFYWTRCLVAPNAMFNWTNWRTFPKSSHGCGSQHVLFAG